jgi:hypothetical protein
MSRRQLNRPVGEAGDGGARRRVTALRGAVRSKNEKEVICSI